jgi:hypothetical protein
MLPTVIGEQYNGSANMEVFRMTVPHRERTERNQMAAYC